MEECISYYPEYSRLMPDGSLWVRIAGTAEEGEKFDGAVVITPDDPRYDAWLQVYLEAEKRREVNRHDGHEVPEEG